MVNTISRLEDYGRVKLGRLFEGGVAIRKVRNMSGLAPMSET